MALNETSRKKNLSANNSQEDHKIKNEFNKLPVSKKVFTYRESLLTSLNNGKVDHLHGILNCIHVASLLLLLDTILFYLAESSKFWDHLSILIWATSKFSYFVIFLLFLNLVAFAFYEGFRLWIIMRNTFSPKIADRFFLLLYIASFLFLLQIVPDFYMNKINFPPICSFAAVFEQFRICMKIHSFVRENISRVKLYQSKKDGEQQHVICPSRGHYLYYLFAPTLIYRDSYPRLESRRWWNVFYNCYKFGLSILLMCCAFMRFNVAEFKNVGSQPLTRREAMTIFLRSIMSALFYLPVMLYCLLHSWLNIFAELLKFGDKEFYQDWWNSTSYSHYLRRWNVVVQDWLHAYIYRDLQLLGCSHVLCVFVVIALSAAVHEYALSQALGFLYPMLFLMYSTLGFGAIFMTKGLTSHYWNIFFWCSISLGFGILVYLYTLEFYARINCPKEENYWNFYIPRSWDPSCKILH